MTDEEIIEHLDYLRNTAYRPGQYTALTMAMAKISEMDTLKETLDMYKTELRRMSQRYHDPNKVLVTLPD